MSTKQIASSTLWQVASQGVMAALSIVTVKFVAMGLSAELAGTYNSAYGFLQIFGILADFGLYAVAVRELSRAEDKPRVMGALIILRSIILGLSLASALLITWLLPAWNGTPLPLAVSIAALVPFFTLLSGIQRTIFQVSYRMHYVFIAEVAQRIIAVLMIGIVIAQGVRDSSNPAVMNYMLLAGSVGALVLFLFSTLYVRKLMQVKLRWDGEEIKRLLVLALPYGLAFFCTALYRQTDVTLIAMLRDDFQLQNAYYGFALRAVEMAYLFPTFLLNSTLPILSKRDADGEDTRGFVGKIFFAILLLSTTVFLYSVLWARPVMRLLTTEEYLSSATHAGSDTALELLAIPMLLNGIVLFCFYSMLTRHAWKPLVNTLAIGALVSLGMNSFLIPEFGFEGAAYTSIATHGFLALLLLPQALQILPMQITRTQVLQWITYTILLGGGLWLAAPFLTSSLITVIALLASFIYLGAIALGTRITQSLKV